MEEKLEVEHLNESQVSQSDNFINFKLIIIGDAGVGKSYLFKRAVQNIFEDNYQATIGFEFLLMHFKVNDLKIKFQIWDTCGQEMYRSLVQGFYHNSSLAIIVYDISKKPTFDSLEIWLRDLKQHIEQDLPVFIVGNKIDLERSVTTEEGKNFQNLNNIVYFTECSAKRGYNVKEIFIEAAKYLYQIYKKFKIQDKIPLAKRLKLNKKENEENNNKKKKNCCK